jgi:cytochrome c oxidase subunit 2
MQQQPAQEPMTDEARRGRDLFLHETCINCHTVNGTPATGNVGPNLTHVGSRSTLGAGVIENSPENLMSWISDSHAIKPGVLMPRYIDLSDNEIQALAAWLEGMR